MENQAIYYEMFSLPNKRLNLAALLAFSMFVVSECVASFDDMITLLISQRAGSERGFAKLSFTLLPITSSTS
jgi:hypothetical protein